DLHPAQLPTRYAATYAFYRDGLQSAVERLHRYATGAAGGILDEPATARALADFLVRGLDCGALHDDETDATGMERAALTTLARPLRSLQGSRWRSSWATTGTARPRPGWCGSSATRRGTRSAT